MTDSNFATIDFARFFGPDPGGSTAISGIQNFALTMPLELFLAWRGSGLLVETPGVRW